MKLTHWLTLWQSNWQPALEATANASFSGFNRFLKHPSGQMRYLQEERSRRPVTNARSQLPMTARSVRPTD